MHVQWSPTPYSSYSAFNYSDEDLIYSNSINLDTESASELGLVVSSGEEPVVVTSCKDNTMKKITDSRQLKLGFFFLLISFLFHSAVSDETSDSVAFVDGNGICPLPEKNEFSDSTGPPPSTCPVNPLYGQHLRVLVLEVS